MSVNTNGKLEFVRNDKEAIQSTKIKDQLVSKPIQPNNLRNANKPANNKLTIQTKHVTRPVQVRYASQPTINHTPINQTHPQTQNNTSRPIALTKSILKQDYLKPYFSLDSENEGVKLIITEGMVEGRLDEGRLDEGRVDEGRLDEGLEQEEGLAQDEGLDQEEREEQEDALLQQK